MIAARVAAKLREDGEEVEMERGGFGELSVHADGRKVADTSRLWYPSPGSVVERAKAALNKREG